MIIPKKIGKNNTKKRLHQLFMIQPLFYFYVKHCGRKTLGCQLSFLNSEGNCLENMDEDKLVWHPIDTLPQEGGIKKIKIDGRMLCLIEQEGRIYATGARCPHAGADLSHGWCKQGKLVCPVHRHQFDLETGRGDPGQGNFIPVFPVQTIQGKPCVGIKISWWRRLFSGG